MFYSFVSILIFFFITAACVIGVGSPSLPIPRPIHPVKDPTREPVSPVEESIKQPIEDQVALDAGESPIPGKKSIPPVLSAAKRRRLDQSPTRSSSVTIDAAKLRDEVLKEQLELIRFQKQELQLKAKRDELEHNSKMELLAIKTK